MEKEIFKLERRKFTVNIRQTLFVLFLLIEVFFVQEIFFVLIVRMRSWHILLVYYQQITLSLVTCLLVRLSASNLTC